MRIFKFLIVNIAVSIIAVGCVSEPTEPTVPALASAVRDDGVKAIDNVYPPGTIELNFQSDGDRLNGHLYLANGAGPHPTIVLLHGYPGNERNLDLAQALRRDGFNVLFFHYRGAWGSEGVFSFTHVIEDVGSALGMLRERAEDYRVDPDRLVLVGHSMGGFAALHGAARDASIQCVAGIAAADLGVRAGLFLDEEAAANSFAAYSDSLQMLSGWSGEKALSEIDQNRDRFSVSALAPALSGKSVLLVAADRDGALPPDDFHAPMVAAFSVEEGLDLTEKTISGDHSFSWSRQPLIDIVLQWAAECR